MHRFLIALLSLLCIVPIAYAEQASGSEGAGSTGQTGTGQASGQNETANQTADEPSDGQSGASSNGCMPYNSYDDQPVDAYQSGGHWVIFIGDKEAYGRWYGTAIPLGCITLPISIGILAH